jgi:hypothetical protein|tara:strand:- start:131 stop:325 length:195 start_codon:yes stop_codon:yes gene_type:complete
MKVKILQKCFAGTGGNLMTGEEYELDVRTAERLIARGLATKVIKKAAPKKTNRAVEGLATPEDD